MLGIFLNLDKELKSIQSGGRLVHKLITHSEKERRPRGMFAEVVMKFIRVVLHATERTRLY